MISANKCMFFKVFPQTDLTLGLKAAILFRYSMKHIFGSVHLCVLIQPLSLKRVVAFTKLHFDPYTMRDLKINTKFPNILNSCMNYGKAAKNLERKSLSILYYHHKKKA